MNNILVDIEKQVNASIEIESKEQAEMLTNVHFFSNGDYNRKPMRFIDFIETEVFERENCDKELIIDIAKKYNLSLDSIMRWVAIRWQDAAKYNDNYGIDDITELIPGTISTVNKDEGFLIEELYDGDGGFPFVYYKKE